MSVNVQDRKGATALFHAVLQRKKAAAALLLQYGADCNLQGASLDGYRGVSPLVTAVRYPATYTDARGRSRQVYNVTQKVLFTQGT